MTPLPAPALMPSSVRSSGTRMLNVKRWAEIDHSKVTISSYVTKA